MRDWQFRNDNRFRDIGARIDVKMPRYEPPPTLDMTKDLCKKRNEPLIPLPVKPPANDFLLDKAYNQGVNNGYI